MRISDLIRQARDQRTKKWRRLSQRKQPDSDADTPGNYKRQTGRCPPGFYINDDSGKCEKISPRKQKQRDRKNRKLRNYRERRRNLHPKINRHSQFMELTMRVSQRISGKGPNSKGEVVAALRAKIREGAGDAFTFISAIKQIQTSLAEIGNQAKRAKAAMPVAGKMVDVLLKHISSASKQNTDILKKIKSAIDDQK